MKKVMNRESVFNEPKIGIIILHHENKDLILNLLDSLTAIRYSNYEVILIDNFSSDGSIDFVRAKFGKNISIVHNHVNLGFTAANNAVLRKSLGKYKYVMLLNNDTRVEPDFLIELVRTAEENPAIGALQPKIKSLRDKRNFEYVGAAGGMVDIYGYPFNRGRLFDTVEEDTGQYDDPADIFFTGGAAMFFRCSVLAEIGLLDELFYSYFEETDICWRTLLAGYKIKYVPGSVVYHLGGATVNYHNPQRIYLIHRNNLIGLIKNYEVKNLLRYFPLRIMFELVSALFYLKKDFRYTIQVFRSLLWITVHFSDILNSRREVQRLRRVSDREIMRLMVKKSVVIQYFLMRRKYFSRLEGVPVN
jgi:GT2 family glycosyltransferase